MLHAISEDLTILLLCDWLQVSLIALSRLDVAFCCRSSRSAWRHILSQVRIKEDKAKRPISNMLQWLHIRQVNVELLNIGVRIANGLDSSSPALHLKTKSIRFIPCPVSSISFNLSVFLSYFPHLTSLDCSGCQQLSDSHLSVIGAQRLSLRRLTLQQCKELSAEGIAEVCVTLSAGLEELHCEGIRDGMMQQLAACCSRMKKLTCSTIDCLHPTSFVSFCSSNPLLSHVTIDGPAVTNVLVEGILLTSPRLQHISIGTRSAVTSEILSFITDRSSSYVNKLHFFGLSGTLIDFHFPQGASSREVYCEVTVKHRGEYFTPRSCLACLMTPIYSLVLSKGDGAKIGSTDIRLLADLHGHTLRKAVLMLRTGLSDQMCSISLHAASTFAGCLCLQKAIRLPW